MVSRETGLKTETTAGSSLARATIVDEDGNILLDELVRQKVPILYGYISDGWKELTVKGSELEILRCQSGRSRQSAHGLGSCQRSCVHVYWTRHHYGGAWVSC